MSDYTVLAEVGESLVRILWQEIQTDPQVNALIDNENRISLESPFDLRENDSVRLSLYLYRIVEDPHTKNRFPIEGNWIRRRKPHLTLDLNYLVTPLVGSPREQQIVLGKVMQVLYDRAILEGTDLVGSLATSGQEVHLILNPVSLEETTRVWQALEISYRLSVCYVARVAMIDSTREEFTQPVLQKSDQYGIKSRGDNGAV
jgi:Pvc16 N-terminal domain